MNLNLEICESKDCLKLQDIKTNEIIAEISLNEYVSKDDAERFLTDIKKHINVKQSNQLQEKMKKVDEKMQKVHYDLEELNKLYDATEDKFEKQLIYSEIRSIEILNTIQIEAIDKKD